MPEVVTAGGSHGPPPTPWARLPSPSCSPGGPGRWGRGQHRRWPSPTRVQGRLLDAPGPGRAGRAGPFSAQGRGGRSLGTTHGSAHGTLPTGKATWRARTGALLPPGLRSQPPKPRGPEHLPPQRGKGAPSHGNHPGPFAHGADLCLIGPEGRQGTGAGGEPRRELPQKAVGASEARSFWRKPSPWWTSSS